MIADVDIVFKYGLIAELMGSTNVTDQAYTDGDNFITPAGTNIPISIIGNQQQKYVATMEVTLAVMRTSSLISLLRLVRFDDLKTSLNIST